jgi:hypothetical protein
VVDLVIGQTEGGDARQDDGFGKRHSKLAGRGFISMVEGEELLFPEQFAA